MEALPMMLGMDKNVNTTRDLTDGTMTAQSESAGMGWNDSAETALRVVALDSPAAYVGIPRSFYLTAASAEAQLILHHALAGPAMQQRSEEWAPSGHYLWAKQRVLNVEASEWCS